MRLSHFKPNLGISYFLLTITLLCMMDVCIKAVAQNYDLIQIVFFRNFFAMLPLFFMVYKKTTLEKVLKTNKLFSHFMRAVLGVIAMLGFAYGFKHMSLDSVYAIEFTSPFFMILLGWLFFKEQVTKNHFFAIALGFMGVLIVINPQGTTFQQASLIVLGAACLFAWNAFHIKMLSQTDTNETVVFYFLFFCALLAGVFLPFCWKTPNLQDFILMLAIGIFNGLAQIYFSKAVDHAPVSTLAPFYYGVMIWGVIFGFVFWHDVPTPHVIIGSLIVISCGLYTTYITNKAHKTHGTEKTSA